MFTRGLDGKYYVEVHVSSMTRLNIKSRVAGQCRMRSNGDDIDNRISWQGREEMDHNQTLKDK
jgi:hypothetical protein